MATLKKICLTASILSAFCFNQAQAQSACLSQASNPELIAELNFRLTSGGGGHFHGNSDLTISATCTAAKLLLTIWNPVENKINRTEFNLVFADECAKSADIIKSRAPQLFAGGLLGICESAVMTTVFISNTGTVQTSKTNYTFSSTCEEEARRINQ